MSVVSIRFSDQPVHERLRETARRQHVSLSNLAERLIDEGLRTEAHPLVIFRSGAGGRRAVLVGGPEVADVVGAIVGGDVPATDRRSRAADVLNVSETMVDAALAYYADFTEDIDSLLAERARRADEAEAAWRRQQALLER
ncbi:MAG: CopG family transcriptional regulator [Ilumatobacteraceae bacterium]